MLEWDHLRVVLAVHRGGSMQAASQLLSIDRATVLRRLDSLEARLGARLFERRRDGCVLTRAGLEIIATAEGIEQAMTALEHRVHGEDRRAEGVVTVTVPEFFAVKVLVPALPRLSRAHPGLTVEIRTGHGFLNLARGEADIALRNRRPDHNSLVSRRVGTVAIALYASRAYLDARGTPEAGDYASHDVILFDESLAGMPGYDWVAEHTARSRIAMRSNEILPLLAAARAGAGIAYLPVIAAFGEPDLVAIPPGIIGAPEIFLITHRDLRRRARVRVAFDFIVRLCTEQASALAGTAIAEALAVSSRQAPVSATARRPAAPSRAGLVHHRHEVDARAETLEERLGEHRDLVERGHVEDRIDRALTPFGQEPGRLGPADAEHLLEDGVDRSVADREVGGFDFELGFQHHAHGFLRFAFSPRACGVGRKVPLETAAAKPRRRTVRVRRCDTRAQPRMRVKSRKRTIKPLASTMPPARSARPRPRPPAAVTAARAARQ